jgi:DNA polymerase (family 10)
MARAAVARGDTHNAITDHSAPFAMVGGLDAARLAEQADEIDIANAEMGGEFTVLKGIELEVLADGSLGLDDQTLATLDWVVASTHVSQRQSAAEMTARVEAAMRNPFVDCIAHPTGRTLLRRPPSNVDTDRLIELALETGTLLEINANPRRLDMSADLARRALEAGVTIAVNSDAHGANTLSVRSYGVPVARRAGATPSQVVNTWGWSALRDTQKRWRA